MAPSDTANNMADAREAVENSRAAGAPPQVEIGKALDEGLLEVWYQPRIDLKRKCLAGAEALICLRHPERGALMPGEFVCGPESEIALLSESMLQASLNNWSLFEEAGFNLTLTIGVPARVLLDLPIGELVAEHRPSSDRWPGVILQVAEDELVRDRNVAREVAERLRAAGVKLALDRFGSGQSRLSSLRDLPFVELKLDGTFVTGCATDAANGAICQTVIDLAHRFGAAASASPIENQADLQVLMAMGCDFGQGGLVSPPMSQTEFLNLLRERVAKPRPQPSAEAQASAGSINRVA
jgi:EAL domain-containing protein (putative c-di-GMP-specific phosphodiesterase class I)